MSGFTDADPLEVWKAQAADDLFTYHAPNERTMPVYKAIRAAEEAFNRALVTLGNAVGAPDAPADPDLAPHYDAINGAARCLFEAVPASSSRFYPHYTAGIVALVLARNAANEAIATKDWGRLPAIARSKIQEARWLFCGAVALTDAVDQRNLKG